MKAIFSWLNHSLAVKAVILALVVLFAIVFAANATGVPVYKKVVSHKLAGYRVSRVLVRAGGQEMVYHIKTPVYRKETLLVRVGTLRTGRQAPRPHPVPSGQPKEQPSALEEAIAQSAAQTPEAGGW